MANFKDRLHAAFARYLRDEHNLDAVSVNYVSPEEEWSTCGEGTCDYNDEFVEVEYTDSHGMKRDFTVREEFWELISKLTDD
ncbi:hypothetical protein ACFU44_00680 [Nocardia rhizosphaerihabitans]|uniref:hypothetical protein n=1 Tax=Nocardia rhizosphaerihabitans TaxID=1691570 RepID=UPI00366C3792